MTTAASIAKIGLLSKPEDPVRFFRTGFSVDPELLHSLHTVFVSVLDSFLIPAVEVVREVFFIDSLFVPVLKVLTFLDLYVLEEPPSVVGCLLLVDVFHFLLVFVVGRLDNIAPVACSALMISHTLSHYSHHLSSLL